MSTSLLNLWSNFFHLSHKVSTLDCQITLLCSLNHSSIYHWKETNYHNLHIQQLKHSKIFYIKIIVLSKSLNSMNNLKKMYSYKYKMNTLKILIVAPISNTASLLIGPISTWNIFDKYQLRNLVFRQISF